MHHIQNIYRIIKSDREKWQLRFRQASADLKNLSLKARMSWNNIYQGLKKILLSSKFTITIKSKFHI